MRCLRWKGFAFSLGLLSAVGTADGAPVDFSTFDSINYQAANGFSEPDWQVLDLVEGSGDALIAAETTNSYPTVLYGGPDDARGSRIKYLWRPGGDDDLSGFVLGFDPGTPATPVFADPSAQFLVFDWKRVEQTFNFADPLTAEGEPGNFINDSTGETTAPALLRAGFVSGVPSSDELWGKVNLGVVDGAAFPDTGGVTHIADGSTAGTAGYGANQDYIVEIEYAADRVRVLLDGVEEFNFTPADVPGLGLTEFPAGRFGVYEAYQNPGGVYSQVDIRSIGDASAPDPQPLPVAGDPPLLPGGVKAFVVDATNEDAEVNPSAWSIQASTSGDNQVFVVSGPNNGDVDFVYGPEFDPSDLRVSLGFKASPATIATPADGVMIATVAQNGGRMRDTPGAEPIYATAEAPSDSGFGGVRGGLAVGETLDGSESTARVAAAFFPYTDSRDGKVGFTAGIVRDAAESDSDPFVPAEISISNSVYGSAVVETVADGVYNLSIGDRDSQTDGLLLAVGGANNNNVVGAAPQADGSWAVAVRENRARGGDEDFTASAFNYVYLDAENTEGLTGGYVTGFDATEAAELGIAVGDFALIREGVGDYRLSLPSDTPEDGVLLLTNAETMLLADQSTVTAANYYLTYEADGPDFLIQMRQLVEGAAPTPVDGDFTFAFVGYDGRLAATPEPGAAMLAATACGVALARRRRD